MKKGVNRRAINRNFIHSKKSQSNIITIVLLIIIIIALIVVIWMVIKGVIKKNLEVTEIKANLLSEKIDLGDVEISDYQINITLEKGPGKEVLVNETIIKKNSSIVFVLDSTASMVNEIEAIKNIIGTFSENLNNENVNSKMALIEFKDYPVSPCGSSEDFPYKIWQFDGFPFTNNSDDINDSLSLIIVSGGFDTPESHLSAIEQAINLDYSGVDLKFIILLTDAPPHAKDCSCGTYFTTCYSGSTFRSCYTGPETIEEVKQDLIQKNIKYYEINKINQIPYGAENGVCDNNATQNMATESGGKFFSYTEIGGVDEILLEISDEIKREYETLSNWNYLSVIFYNGTSSYEYKIYDVPGILETKTYYINMSFGENPTSQYISDVTRIEVYPVAIASSGQKIIGQRVSYWEKKQGVFANMKNFFGF